MKSKKIVFVIIIFTVIFTLIINSTKNTYAKQIINNQMDIGSLNNITGNMSAKFTEEGKSTINLTENTVYNGWNYNNIGRLNITLSELDIDIVYKLIITMDKSLYLPVDV